MNPHHRVMVLAGAVLVVAYGALAPRKTWVRVESSPGNPVQRIVLESRSLFGLERHAWGGGWRAPMSGAMGERASFWLQLRRFRSACGLGQGL